MIQYDKLSREVKEVVERLIALMQKGHGKLEVSVADGKIVYGHVTESFKLDK